MEINFKEAKTSWNPDTKEVDAVVRFSVAVEQLINRGYGHERLGERITEQVSTHIANHVIKEKGSHIVKSIDINDIIKRINLNIVQNVARS